MQTYELTLCHLYPEHLNLYGDNGNVLAFQRIAKARGIKLQCLRYEMESSGYSQVPPADIYFMGGGQDHEQSQLLHDFLHVHGEFFIRELQANKVFLAICGAYQLLGKYFLQSSGKKLPCLDFLPIYTEGSDERLVGNIVLESSLFEGADRLLFGFENHSGRTYFVPEERQEAQALAKVLVGYGNNGKDAWEGSIKNNCFATYCHGSFLPKNPRMTNELLNLAIQNKYQVEEKTIYYDVLAEKLRYQLAKKFLGKEDFQRFYPKKPLF